MISKMAMEDIDSLAQEGIRLTPKEIIRLNAFGLKVEKGTDAAEHFQLPRVALLGKLEIRQPTIGSEIWFSQASQVYDINETDTYTMIRLYSLSKDQSQLVDPYNKELVNEEMSKLKELVKPFTVDQVSCALDYAIEGINDFDGESSGYSRKSDADDDDDDDLEFDQDYSCIEYGMLLDGLTLGIGTEEDLRKMTTSMLHFFIEYKSERQWGARYAQSHRNERLAEYYFVLSDIKKAHTSEKHEVENG